MAISLAADRPATSRQAVVFACDAAYAPYALFASHQIATHVPVRSFDICIASAGAPLAVPQSLAGLGLRRCGIDAGGIFAGLGHDARRSEAVFLRLALPAAFAADYDRLLYLDADVFVQSGDFAGLLGLDIGGHALAAVRDNIQWRTPARKAAVFGTLGLRPAAYFNSGVLMIDVARYLEQRLLERCLDLANGAGHDLPGHDQDLLNGVLHGDWAEISPVWNWQYTRASQLFEALEGANIVHFIGAKKPWRHTGGALPLRFRRAYRGFLAAHLPAASQIGPDGAAPHQNRGYLRGMLTRHLMSVGRFADYLDRFEGELSVIV